MKPRLPPMDGEARRWKRDTSAPIHLPQEGTLLFPLIFDRPLSKLSDESQVSSNFLGCGGVSEGLFLKEMNVRVHFSPFCYFLI